MKKLNAGEMVKWQGKEYKVLTRSKDFSNNKISYKLEGVGEMVPEELLEAEVAQMNPPKVEDLENEELKQKFAEDLIDSETEEEEEEEEEETKSSKKFKRTKK